MKSEGRAPNTSQHPNHIRKCDEMSQFYLTAILTNERTKRYVRRKSARSSPPKHTCLVDNEIEGEINTNSHQRSRTILSSQSYALNDMR